MCLHFYLALFEQVGYSIVLVQYRKVFSDQYNFFERVDLTFVLLYDLTFVLLCAYDCCFTTREANCFKDVGTGGFFMMKFMS